MKNIITNLSILTLLFMFQGCATSNQHLSETEGSISEYESSGHSTMASTIGEPSAALLFIWMDYFNYKNFNLNKEEKNMHNEAVYFSLNHGKNGEITSWHSKKRVASGKVRIIHSFVVDKKPCRTYQSFIKLNGAEKHSTHTFCKTKELYWSPYG